MLLRFTAALLLLSSHFAASQNMFHANPAHTGIYEGAGPAQLGGVQWTFHTAGPIVSSPAIVNGVMYIGSWDGHLYAVDQETGKEKWKYKSQMPIASSPAVVDGTVYFVSSGGALGAL